jgi:hypothetical protein
MKLPFRSGVHAFMMGTLDQSHEDAWMNLWNTGRIDVSGNVELARINYAALYYLYSSLPLKADDIMPFIGLSPGGLAHGALNKVSTVYDVMNITQVMFGTLIDVLIFI